MRAFEQQMWNVRHARSIFLNFKVESGNEPLAQKRINFYAKLGYKLVVSKLVGSEYHMNWLKVSPGRAITYELADATFRPLLENTLAQIAAGADL